MSIKKQRRKIVSDHGAAGVHESYPFEVRRFGNVECLILIVELLVVVGSMNVEFLGAAGVLESYPFEVRSFGNVECLILNVELLVVVGSMNVEFLGAAGVHE